MLQALGSARPSGFQLIYFSLRDAACSACGMLDKICKLGDRAYELVRDLVVLDPFL